MSLRRTELKRCAPSEADEERERVLRGTCGCLAGSETLLYVCVHLCVDMQLTVSVSVSSLHRGGI